MRLPFRKKVRDSVVYTCLFGHIERFNNIEYYDDDVDYVCFTDDASLTSDTWKMVHVPTSGLDSARFARKFKLLPALYLQGYERSLYIDNTVKLKVKPSSIFDEFAGRSWVMVRHPWRDCIYEEAKAVIEAGFDDPEVVNAQMEFYRSQGYPEHNGLNAGTFILRRHNDDIVKHMGAEWWAQVLQHSRRDQLSWNYCAWRQRFEFHSIDQDLNDNNYFTWPHLVGVRLPRDFDDAVYLSLNPDVAEGGLNPRLHYIGFGHAEGRRYKLDPVENEQDKNSIRLVGSNRLNDKHSHFVETRAVTIRQKPLFSKEDRIFTMGSCFAEEIRKALTKNGWGCLPDYKRIEFDPNKDVVDTLPNREHMNFYNSFTVRTQIEQICGVWEQDPQDYWTVPRISKEVVPFAARPVYQDPYRRCTFSDTPEGLQRLVCQIVGEMRRSFDEATGFVFTFGMAEVFVNRFSGKVACQKPAYAGGAGMTETYRHDSTFEENLDNLRTVVQLIRKHKGNDIPIIMSVSPVPLARTFTENDVVTTNGEGKAILRAAIGQITREFDNVTYIPSYEVVTLQGMDAYDSDLRHVKEGVVQEIMDGFFDGFNKAKKIYIDLGSNHGVTIEKFIHDHPDFEVFGFEPATQLAQELRDKFSGNENVKIMQAAAWVADDLITFYPGGPSDESSTLLTGKSEHSPWTIDYDKGYSVQGMDIVKWLQENTSDGDKVIMKMDVEGSEYRILRRLMETGAVTRLSEIRVEWHWDRYPDEITEEEHHQVRDKLKSLVKVVDWH